MPTPTCPPMLRRPLAVCLLTLFATTLAHAAPVQVDLPSQALKDAIQQLASLTGLTIAVDAQLVAGKMAPAVKGQLEAPEAIDKLLAGSGLTATFQGSQVLITQAAPVLREVKVSADVPHGSDGATASSGGMYVPAQTLGPFGPTAVQDNPFSTTSIPSTILRDQQVKTLTEAARNDASYGSYLTVGSSGYSNFFIRGIPTDVPTNNRIDGLPVTTQSGIVMQGYERIDIYHGLSALQYGFTGAGGIVNYVSKRPLVDPLSELSLGYTNSSDFTGAVDLSRRFGTDNEAGARLNLMKEHGNGPVDHSSVDSYLGALALDWNLLPATTLWLNASDSRNGHYGLQPTLIVSGRAVPDAPEASHFFGTSFTQHVGTTRGLEGGLESKLSDTLSLHLAIGDFRATRDVLGNAAILQDGAGDFRMAITPHNLWTLEDKSAELTISSNNQWGTVNSRTDLAVTANNEETGVQKVQPIKILSQPSNIYDPVQYADPQIPYAPGAISNTWNSYRNYILRETLDWGGGFSLIGALAYSQINTSDNQSASDSVQQSATTPTLALVYKATPALNVYASYTEGLTAGAQAGADYGSVPVANAGVTLAPYVSRQTEVGAKYQLGDALQANAAAFQIKQASAIYQPTDATKTEYVLTQNGEQVNDGLELSLAGKVSRSLALFGGATYIDAKLTHTQDGTLDGKYAFGIPKYQANLFAEYSVEEAPGLTVLGGAYYTGSKWVDSANQYTIPSNLTFDAGLKYSTQLMQAPATIRFYVQNLTDRSYWTANVYGPVVTLGDPRTFKLELAVKL